MSSPREPGRAAGDDPPRSPVLAYALNVVLPGAGNIYVRQRVAGIALMALLALSGFIVVIETSAVAMGIILLIASVILAVFTVGASLIIGGPVAISFLLIETGPLLVVLVYASALVASQVLVFVRVSQAGDARHRPPSARPARTDNLRGSD